MRDWPECCLVVLLALSLGLFSGGSLAKRFEQGPIVVEKPWARATFSAERPGVAYMTLVNRGDEPDRLQSVRSEVAKRVELHTRVMEGGVLKMRPLKGGLPLPPGKTIVLRPGDLHIMLVDLKKPLQEGEQIPITLVFKRAGELPIQVNVLRLGAMAPPGSGGE